MMAFKKYNVEDTEKTTKCLGVRHIQIVLIACMAGIYFGKNVNLSVAIVAMTNTNEVLDVPTYNWTDSNIILSSYYWPTFPCQMLAGQLSERYGSKWLLTGAALFSSIFTGILPFMAELGSWGVMICRFMQGATQAIFFPSAFNLIAKWAPVPERTRLCNVLFTGTILGTITSMSLTGLICGSSVGWPLVFYLSGSIAFIWLIFWIWLGYDSPQNHPSISEAEKDYILSTQGAFIPVKSERTPWLAIFKSLPVWAIFIGNCSFNWGFFMMLSQIPTYLNAIFGFDISSNGLLSALPYIVNAALNNVFSIAFDYVINQKIVSATNSRKIATSIGVLCPAIALIALGILGRQASATIVVTLLVIAVALNSAITSGFLINNTDIAPNYAATVSALTNGSTVVFSILGPIVVQLVVTDLTNADQWGVIFYITAAFYVVAGVFYLIFGSAEVQEWNAEGFKKDLPT